MPLTPAQKAKMKETLDLFIDRTKEEHREMVADVLEDGAKLILQSDTIAEVQKELGRQIGFIDEQLHPERMPPELTVLESYKDLGLAKIKQDLLRQLRWLREVHGYFNLMDGNFEITTVNGTTSHIPVFNDIIARLTPETIARLEELKFPTLVVTPLGLPLDEIKEKVASKNGRLTREGKPSYQKHVQGGNDASLIYFPHQYKTEGTGGYTKEEIAKIMPWSVVVVEGGKDTSVDTIGKIASDLLELHKSTGMYDSLTMEELLVLQAIGTLNHLQSDQLSNPLPYDSHWASLCMGSVSIAGIDNHISLPSVRRTGSNSIFIVGANGQFPQSGAGLRNAVRLI